MSESPPVNRTGQAIIGICVLIACCATVGWLLVFGKADNSLHSSALSWSFTLIGVIVIGFGIGAALPQILELVRRT